MRASYILIGVLASLPVPPAEAVPEVDPRTALQQGNRLFQDGRFEAAAEAYAAGYSPTAPHATLAYNLGTALHHAGRLPEAILWYRRAALAEDPWLDQNLQLARHSLGNRVIPAGGLPGWLGRRAAALRLTAIALAWVTLLAVAAAPRLPTWAFACSAATALAIYGATAGIERRGPGAAVILQDCSTPAGDLPAGTEVWVHRRADGSWRISGTADAVCPPASAALVFPDR